MNFFKVKGYTGQATEAYLSLELAFAPEGERLMTFAWYYLEENWDPKKYWREGVVPHSNTDAYGYLPFPLTYHVFPSTRTP